MKPVFGVISKNLQGRKKNLFPITFLGFLAGALYYELTKQIIKKKAPKFI